MLRAKLLKQSIRSHSHICTTHAWFWWDWIASFASLRQKYTFTIAFYGAVNRKNEIQSNPIYWLSLPHTKYYLLWLLFTDDLAFVESSITIHSILNTSAPSQLFPTISPILFRFFFQFEHWTIWMQYVAVHNGIKCGAYPKSRKGVWIVFNRWCIRTYLNTTDEHQNEMRSWSL